LVGDCLMFIVPSLPANQKLYKRNIMSFTPVSPKEVDADTILRGINKTLRNVARGMVTQCGNTNADVNEVLLGL
jgi:hypothetical protein